MKDNDLTSAIEFLEVLTERSGERFDDVSYVATRCALGILKRGKDLSSNGSQVGVREVLDTPRDAEIGRLLPRLESERLRIMAWAARANVSNAGGEPAGLSWCNSSLLGLISDLAQTQECLITQCSIGPICQPRCNLDAFLKFYAGGPGGPESPLQLTSFIRRVTSPSQTVDWFLAALREAPKLAMEASRSPAPWADRTYRYVGGSWTLDWMSNDSAVLPIEIFVSRTTNDEGNTFNWAIGVQCAPPAGINVAPGSGEVKIPDTCDLFGVWQVKRTSGRLLVPEDFIAIQGTLISADLRKSINLELERESNQARTAAIAARNVSHSLGSHALNHLSSSLRSTNPDLSRFTDYLQQRAALIAMLASGYDTDFAVSLPITSIINEFNEQFLLKALLCRTEQCEVSDVVIRGTNDFRIDAPSAGRQAFFAILENFARNSSKHSPRRDNQSRTVQTVMSLMEEGETLLCTMWDANAQGISAESLKTFQCALKGVRAGSGLGASEISIWAKYLSGDDALIPPDGDGPEGQLRLHLRFRRPRFVSDADDWKGSSSQFTIFRSNTGLDANSDRGSGRWVAAVPSNGGYNVATRFGQLLDQQVPWHDLAGIELALAVQRSYLDTLLAFTLGAKESVALVIADNVMFERSRTLFPNKGGEIELPFGAIRARVVKERFGLTHLTTLFGGAKLAIWDRHGHLRSAMQRGEGVDNVVHYESFNTTMHPYRDALPALLDPDELHVQWLCGFLAEAALSRGVVFDERLSKMHQNDEQAKIAASLAGIILLDPFDHDHIRYLKEPQLIPRERTCAARYSFASLHASLARNVQFELASDWGSLIEELELIYPILSFHSGAGGNRLYPESLFTSWAIPSPCKLFLTEALARKRGTGGPKCT